MFNSDSFPTSAALVERRALRSAVLCYNGAVHCLCSLCIPLSLPFVTHHLARPPHPRPRGVSRWTQYTQSGVRIPLSQNGFEKSV